jgi:hypothetical protein
MSWCTGKRSFAVAVLALAAVPAWAAGKNGTTLAASKTIDICQLADGSWHYSGEVSVWNEGAVATVGLAIQDCIQNKTDSGPFVDTYCGNLSVTEIPAGTTEPNATVFPYSFDAAPLDPYIRNVARVTILNHSGSIGIPKGPQPRATWTGLVEACVTECGCVLTQGYWKTHPESWPEGFPTDAAFYLSGNTWMGVLNTEPAGNKYYNLAHQYIAATLNQASGACVPSGVQDVLDLATAWLAANAPSACPLPSSCGLQNTWAGILDDYNNGLYPGGPAHCE